MAFVMADVPESIEPIAADRVKSFSVHLTSNAGRIFCLDKLFWFCRF